MEDIDYPSLICDEWMLSLASLPGLSKIFDIISKA